VFDFGSSAWNSTGNLCVSLSHNDLLDCIDDF